MQSCVAVCCIGPVRVEDTLNVVGAGAISSIRRGSPGTPSFRSIVCRRDSDREGRQPAPTNPRICRVAPVCIPFAHILIGPALGAPRALDQSWTINPQGNDTVRQCEARQPHDINPRRECASESRGARAPASLTAPADQRTWSACGSGPMRRPRVRYGSMWDTPAKLLRCMASERPVLR